MKNHQTLRRRVLTLLGAPSFDRDEVIIFQNIQRNLAALGLSSNDSTLNIKQAGYICASSSTIVSNIAYFFLEAKSIEDYMLTTFMLIPGLGIFLVFFNTIFLKKELIGFIDKYQKLTNERE